MVVDTSAVIAIFRQEPEASAFAALIEATAAPRISAASVIEAAIVLRGLKQVADGVAELWLDEFLEVGGFVVEPVTVAQVEAARAAHRAYGRGSGHAAALNYGDCFSYALAKVTGEPLLFKGDDFARTDLARAG